MKKHEAFFNKRLNWTSRNRAPVLENSTEMKVLMGQKKVGELSKSKTKKDQDSDSDCGLEFESAPTQ